MAGGTLSAISRRQAMPLDQLNQGSRKPGTSAAAAAAMAAAASSGVPLPSSVLFPPEIYPIPGARLFYASGAVGGIAVSAATSPVTLLAQAIPAQSKAVIRTLEWGLNGMVAGVTLASWILQFDGAPQEYGPLVVTPSRTATFVGDARDVVIRVPVGVTQVTILAVIGAADPGTYLMGASVDGWYWTVAQEQAYREGRAG